MVNWYIYQLANGLLRYTDIHPFWAKKVKPKYWIRNLDE